MRVLVTGATGFVGNHVIACLLENNHEVIATSRDSSKAIEKAWYGNVTYIPYDISTVNEEINLYSHFHQPDVLLHLAWHGLPNFLDIVHIEKNLFSHYHFLKNYITNGGKHLACIGTCLEYGMNEGCLREDRIPDPHCAYAVAKDSLRRFIEELHKIMPFTFQWIRLFYMYGKGQYEKAILPQLEAAIQRKDAVFNMSGGEQLRDYLPIEIVAKQICGVALQKEVKGVINCCSGKPISIRKLVEDYILRNNYSIQLNLGYYTYPSYEPMAFWGDNSKSKFIE